MAWNFGDGFDLYAASADMVNGYWDSATAIGNIGLSSPGRFTGSQCVTFNLSNTNLVKSSGVNDAVHHFAVSFIQTAAITGSTLGFYLQLTDGVTAQCSVVFRSDGAILLTSGASTGTVLDTYTGAFPLTSTWYAFEIEIVVNNTTGSWAVRKNGNTVNDRSLGSLNTRTSANNYANKLQIGTASSPVNAHRIDDLFWRSDASSVAWMGDIRCYTRMPASDASVQFSRTSTGALTQTVTATGASVNGSNNAVYDVFVAAYSGTVTSVSVAFFNLSTTVNMKCAIFADNSGAPGAILASATAPVTPVVVGANVFTFSGVTIVKGTAYWVGAASDGAGSFSSGSTQSSAATFSTTSYSAFPQANPVATGIQRSINMSWTYTATPANWQAVSEPQQDGTTSYVYDSTPGDQDFYGIAAITSTPVSTIAVTTRAYMQKSDAGTRTAATQLKSGSTTVASPTLTLSSSGWLWAYRLDLTDPATGAAWTATGVNNVTIGPTTIA